MVRLTDEEVDEEDGSALAGSVVCAVESGLKDCFAYQGDKDAANADEHEASAAEAVNEESCDDVAEKGD